MAYPTDRQYTKDHEWIRLSGDVAEVGITDFAQNQLGDVVYVELPAVGDEVQASASFGSIESVKAVSELFSPVTGQVVEVNAGLTNAPEAVSSDAHGTWLVKVRTTGSLADDLMDAGQYEQYLAKSA